MGIFDFLKGADINEGVQEWQSSPNAILLDVRTTGEYQKGHIQGSINIPLNELNQVNARIPDQDKMIFVHCLSGSRSSQAVSCLKQLGYKNVKNIGGIGSYKGSVVK